MPDKKYKIRYCLCPRVSSKIFPKLKRVNILKTKCISEPCINMCVITCHEWKLGEEGRYADKRNFSSGKKYSEMINKIILAPIIFLVTGAI